MDTELLTALNNLESIIEQIKQSGAGAGAMEDTTPPPPAQTQPPADEDLVTKAVMIMKQMEDEKKKDKSEADKEKLAKSANSPAADDSAETQVKEQPITNLENIQEVAKAVIGMLRSNKGVYKAQAPDPMVKIANAVQLIGDQVMAQNKAIQGLIEGSGIVSTVEKAWDAKQKEIKEAERRPAEYSPDVMKTLDFITKMATGVAPKPAESRVEGKPDAHFISKSLAENDGRLLTGIFSLNANQTKR